MCSFSVAVSIAPGAANALGWEPADNEIVPNQVLRVGKLDVNNSPVADYMKYPGMYPKIGGLIATGGPYRSVKDIYKNGKLTDAHKDIIRKYEHALIATEANPLNDPLRGRDPYRGAFFEGPPQQRM